MGCGAFFGFCARVITNDPTEHRAITLKTYRLLLMSILLFLSNEYRDSLLGPRLVPHIRPGIRHEAVAVRHLHLRQALGIQSLAISDDAVEIENESHHRVDLRRLQQTGLIERHGPV